MIAAKTVREPMNEPTFSSYAEARRQIRNADLLLFRRRDWLGRLIAVAGRSEYVHAAMAGWWKDRLMCVEMTSRRRAGAAPLEPRGPVARGHRRLPGQRRPPAIFPRTGAASDDRHHRQTVRLGESLPRRIVARPAVPLPGRNRTRTTAKRRVGRRSVRRPWPWRTARAESIPCRTWPTA